MTDETVVTEPTEPTLPPTAEEQQQAAVDAMRTAIEEVSEVPRETKPEPVVEPDKPVVVEATPVVADPKADEKTAADAEVAKLNDDLKAGGHKPLTKASEERFRKLHADLSARPTKEALEAEYAPLKEQAARMAHWDSVIQQSNATTEEIQNALGVIQASKSGDPGREIQAADALLTVVRNIYQRNGKELPGMVDPLAEHKDLAEAVEGGMDRNTALRIAQDRAALARTTESNKRLTDNEQLQQEASRATQDIDSLSDQLKAADPQFMQKLDFLIPTLRVIKSTMRPSQWVAAIKDAYLAIPAIPQPAPVVPPKPAVGAVPLRPTGNGASMRQAIPKDPLEAVRWGIEHMDA